MLQQALTKNKHYSLKKAVAKATALFLCIKLLNNFAVYYAESCCCIGLICVNVHSCAEVWIYSDNNVTEGCCSAVGLNLNVNDFP